jgi:hypothetical protein
MDPTQQIEELEKLLIDLEHQPHSDLLIEHLASARSYLIGAMPLEYELSLDMAGQALGEVADHPLRKRISDFIRKQKKVVTS